MRKTMKVSEDQKSDVQGLFNVFLTRIMMEIIDKKFISSIIRIV